MAVGPLLTRRHAELPVGRRQRVQSGALLCEQRRLHVLVGDARVVDDVGVNPQVPQHLLGPIEELVSGRRFAKKLRVRGIKDALADPEPRLVAESADAVGQDARPDDHRHKEDEVVRKVAVVPELQRVVHAEHKQLLDVRLPVRVRNDGQSGGLRLLALHHHDPRRHKMRLRFARVLRRAADAAPHHARHHLVPRERETPLAFLVAEQVHVAVRLAPHGAVVHLLPAHFRVAAGHFPRTPLLRRQVLRLLQRRGAGFDPERRRRVVVVVGLRILLFFRRVGGRRGEARRLLPVFFLRTLLVARELRDVGRAGPKLPRHHSEAARRWPSMKYRYCSF
eukprot:Rhum_TRINITY_DN15243_c0_g1::Rhum_TRINITY_DN15243_c0_g1_i3::g.145976::m.145976